MLRIKLHQGEPDNQERFRKLSEDLVDSKPLAHNSLCLLKINALDDHQWSKRKVRLPENHNHQSRPCRRDLKEPLDQHHLHHKSSEDQWDLSILHQSKNKLWATSPEKPEEEKDSTVRPTHLSWAKTKVLKKAPRSCNISDRSWRRLNKITRPKKSGNKNCRQREIVVRILQRLENRCKRSNNCLQLKTNWCSLET